MRARLAQPLPDVVADVVRTIGIDVEVLARGGDVMPMRANLDRLVEVAAEFAAGGDEVSVGAFLDYLDAAAVEERGLDRGDEPESSAPEIREGIGVRRDRVQLLTVHAAKGLEWDVVCVPGLVDKLFPGVRPADVKGWLTQRGALPWPLRGDRDGLPTAELEGHVDQLEAVARDRALSRTRPRRICNAKSAGSLMLRSLARAACCCAPAIAGISPSRRETRACFSTMCTRSVRAAGAMSTAGPAACRWRDQSAACARTGDSTVAVRSAR